MTDLRHGDARCVPTTNRLTQYRPQPTVTEKGSLTLDVYKRYNWGNPYGGKRNILRGPFGIPTINQNDLAGLNSAGLAQDFDVFGSNTFQLSPG